MKVNEIYHGDCLELMKGIPAKSIDMILCDLPYGTTACKWDVIIPFAPLWEQYERVIKDNGAIVLTASQPFTTDLINSNRKLFKYELIWNKNRSSQFGLAKMQPMKSHENVLVFFKNRGVYNAQKSFGHPNYDKRGYAAGDKPARNEHSYGIKVITNACEDGSRFPKSVLDFSQNWSRQQQIHPTQKPVALFEYLIKTYTNEGETVLDNCAGSHTTAIAAIRTNRKYICIEKELKYHLIGKERIEKELSTPKQNQQFAA